MRRIVGNRSATRWVAVVVAMVTAAALVVSTRGGGDPAEAQAGGGASMAARVDQIDGILRDDVGPEAHKAAIDSLFEIVWANARILPTAGPANAQTNNADQAIRAQEERLARSLQRLVKSDRSPEVRGDALDLKLLLEQASEVARAVGEITNQCGNGDDLAVPPCDQLAPLLDEDTGTEQPGGAGGVIGPGFEVKLRGPFVPPWFANETWQEDVQVTEPIADGECAVIFKETTGLMLRLRFVTMTVVRDPWVDVFGVPRGTTVPIWQMDWVPSEFGKEWNICNSGGSIVKTVTKRVVQDGALNYFWRQFPKG